VFVGAFSLDGSTAGVLQMLEYLLGAVTFLWVVALAASLVLLDIVVVRETLLLANLGVSRGTVLRIALPPIVALEAIFQLAFSALLPS
jgi:hypothetical protein